VPNTTTLFWDRLPMTVTFMSMVSIIFCEKIDERLGYALLFPLCLIGIGSVSWWSFTESHPDWAGDLRIYILGNKKKKNQSISKKKTNRFVFLF
jgi:hypothetical protein